MKVLVALCAVVACCVAKPGGFAYSALAPLNYAAAPAVYAAAPAVSYATAPALSYAAAPAVSYAAAPAVSYGAPSVYATPSVYAAPAVSAPVVAAAPAPVAYATPVVAAPAVAYAAPAVKTIAAAPVVAGVKTQYHAQDELGQASYGHSEPGQVHNAVQDAYGNKVGSFSYVNPEGNVLRTDYVADGAGYRVASNALPAAPIVQPIDTAEVAAAKANFYAQYHAEASKVRARRSVLVQTPASTQPLATAVVARVPAPVAYSAPVAYAAKVVAPLSYAAAAVPAPLSYAAALQAPVSYGPVPVSYGPAPVSYGAARVSYAAAVPAPVSYATAVPAPVSYAGAIPAPVSYAASPVAYSAPAFRAATLTTVVNNPGHAVSYRVD